MGITPALVRFAQGPLGPSANIVYNNHYFLNSDTRRIITHKVRDNKTSLFQIQDFARVQRP